MLVGNLSDLEQSQLVLVLDQSTTLNVSPGLVGDLHYELMRMFLATEQIVQDVQVDGSSQVIDVGQETVFASLIDEFLQET